MWQDDPVELGSGLAGSEQRQIFVDGAVVHGPAPSRAVVFQDAALLPWRTVLRNVEMGLEMQRKYNKPEIRARSLKQIEMVGLKDFANDYPHQLSGGMRQRVNLPGRSLQNRMCY